MNYEDIVKTYIIEAEDLPNARTVADVLIRVRWLNWWMNQARAYEMQPGFPHDEREMKLRLALSDWLIAHATPSTNVAELAA